MRHNHSGRKSAESAEETGICILLAGHVTSTLMDFGWMRKVNDQNLLFSCLEGLKNRSKWPIIALLEQPCPEIIVELVSAAGAEVAIAESGNLLKSVALTARRLGKQRVMLVHGLLGLELIPALLFAKLTTIHSQAKTHLTLCVDLPTPLFAAICEQEALDLFAALPDNLLSNSDPHSVLSNLGVVAASMSDGLAVLRLSFLSLCSLDRRNVPRMIPNFSKRDLSRIQAAISASVGGTPGNALLELREQLIRDWEHEHRKSSWPNSSQSLSKRTILFASNPSAFSGSEQALISTARSLKCQSRPLHCLVGHEGLFSQRMQAEGVVLHCPNQDFSTSTIPNYLLSGAILDAVSPQILHCNAFVGVPLLAHARSRGISHVQWARLAKFDGMHDHFIAADLVTAVSQFVKDKLVEEMVNPAKIRVVYDGVDVHHFQPEEPNFRIRARQMLGLNDEDFVILCAARFVAYKRHDVLLRGFATALKKNRRLRLILAGDRDAGVHSTLNEVMIAVNSLGISEQVRMLGFIPDSKWMITLADAGVLCSENEPLGCFVLEAMAMGRPMLVTRSGGLPEMITEGENGFLFEAGGSDTLAEQLLVLSENRDLAKRLGADARRIAISRFSLEVHSQAIQQVYDEAIPSLRTSEIGAVGGVFIRHSDNYRE